MIDIKDLKSYEVSTKDFLKSKLLGVLDFEEHSVLVYYNTGNSLVIFTRDDFLQIMIIKDVDRNYVRFVTSANDIKFRDGTLNSVYKSNNTNNLSMRICLYPDEMSRLKDVSYSVTRFSTVAIFFEVNFYYQIESLSGYGSIEIYIIGGKLDGIVCKGCESLFDKEVVK